MRVLSVTQNQMYNGVFFETWDQLKAGLEEYMFGPRDATGQFPKLEFGDKKQRALLDRLYETVQTELQSKYRWKHRYEYDAHGTAFFKTEVKIKRVVSPDNNKAVGYILDLWVAHSDNKDTEIFAKELGRNLVLYSHDIEVSAEPIDETRFELDLNLILLCIQQAFPKMKILSKATLAQNMMDRLQYRSCYDEDNIRDDHFTVVGTPNKSTMIRVSAHHSIRPTDWIVNGNTISGMLTTWHGKTVPEIPKIIIRLSKFWNRFAGFGRDRRNELRTADKDLPICTSREQKRFAKDAEKIKEALEQLVKNS